MEMALVLFLVMRGAVGFLNGIGRGETFSRLLFCTFLIFFS